MRHSGLIAGLGNPGPRYAGTRHNCGFMFVDYLLELASREGSIRELSAKKFYSLLWSVRLPQEEGEWLVAKPQTFMNESGRAIQPLLAWYNLEPDDLLVVQDELDIPAGALRFKFGGGLAGHNGLASIASHLGTTDFYRLRIGIGRPPLKSEVMSWVLSWPDPTDWKKIEDAIPRAVETFFAFARSGPQAAMEFARASGHEAT